ncbi:MAG TPA: type II secretion system secretin GspD [Sandaracinaceae bacterium LLY-WYZ-13_1]|nr:type II secretion system secretin GspD [Sandaracinaceae bacterium LLY-WYZ-13_1]
MRLRYAIPILLTCATAMLSSLGLAIAQDRPQVRIPRPGQRAQQQQGGDDDESPQPAGKLRPFRTGLEGRESRRVPPGARVDFTLEDADLPDLVRMISRITGKRFILPGKARSIKATVASERPVTAAAAYRAFLSILELNGMTVVPSGRYLKIVETSGAESQPLPLYTDGEVTPRQDRYVTRMHRVSNVSAEDVAQLLSRFKSREGNITAYAPTNTIIMTDTGTNIRRMLRILQEIDVPRTGEQIWIEPIHYANAAELASRLQEIFPSAGGEGGGGGGGASSSKASSAAARARRAAAARRRARARQKQGGNDSSGPTTVGSRTGESRITNIIPDERTNSLIILATERAYLRILEVIRALDIPVEGEGSIHVHNLQYADSEQMAQTLQSLIGGSGAASASKRRSKQGGAAAAAGGLGGSFEGQINVQAHKPTNSLLITSSMHDYASLRRVIQRLDVAPRQVFIEAVIMELSVNRSSSLGLAFHGGAPDAPEEGLTVFGFDAARTATPSLSPDLLTGLAVGVRGPEIPQASQLIGFSIPSFGVILNAVAQSGDVNVLSTPHIIAMDNVQAEISVGANVPLQTSGLAGLGGGAGALGALAGQAGQQGGQQGLSGLAGLAGLGSLGGLGGGVQRQNVGTTIRITPHINDAGEIRMEIEEEISEAGEAQGTLGVVPINQRIAKTQVVVRDQQTVVIGGLMRDRVTTSEDKIPILGDIPLLGVLFRRQSTTTQKTNLILFLTPYVIRSPSDLRAIFERKMRERQEFIDRYFVFSDGGYTPPTDYSRTRGLVGEILNTMEEIDAEQQLLEEMQARPPPEHVPRPPIGAAPFDSSDGDDGTVIIGPEGEEGLDDEGDVAPGDETLQIEAEEPAVDVEVEE